MFASAYASWFPFEVEAGRTVCKPDIISSNDLRRDSSLLLTNFQSSRSALPFGLPASYAERMATYGAMEVTLISCLGLLRRAVSNLALMAEDQERGRRGR